MILIKVDSVVKDLAFEEEHVQLVLVSLGKEEFVGDTRTGLFDGNIGHGNGLRSVGKFLDGGVVGRGRGLGRRGSQGIGDKRLSSLRDSLRKRVWRNRRLLVLRRVCNQIFRKVLRVLGRI